MAKSEAEKKDIEGKEEAGTPSQAPGQQQTQQRVEIDDSEIVASYANFCRVTGTPEELIIDFGLNSEPMGVPKTPLKINKTWISVAPKAGAAKEEKPKGEEKSKEGEKKEGGSK